MDENTSVPLIVTKHYFNQITGLSEDSPEYNKEYGGNLWKILF